MQKTQYLNPKLKERRHPVDTGNQWEFSLGTSKFYSHSCKKHHTSKGDNNALPLRCTSMLHPPRTRDSRLATRKGGLRSRKQVHSQKEWSECSKMCQNNFKNQYLDSLPHAGGSMLHREHGRLGFHRSIPGIIVAQLMQTQPRHLQVREREYS